jgi:lipopolysaccharide transport system permease protein
MNQSYLFLQAIWKSRYFWVHLAFSDLHARWRRSFFGLLWCMIQPLGMTFLLSLVLSRLLHKEIAGYAPYIFSGVVVWEFILFSVNQGALSFIQATAYIKQCNQPLPIYTLRTVIGASIVLLLASVPLFCWTLIAMPGNFNFSWIVVPTIYPILLLIAWPVATVLAYIGARFRDLIPALGLIMQAVWFVSPINFEEQLFRSGGIGWLIDYNPIYHILQILRAPLLHGQFPTIRNYSVCFLTALFLYTVAAIVGVKSERKVIFYL